jgi:hypothetical protein
MLVGNLSRGSILTTVETLALRSKTLIGPSLLRQIMVEQLGLLAWNGVHTQISRGGANKKRPFAGCRLLLAIRC